jgi:hypothetical protein
MKNNVLLISGFVVVLAIGGFVVCKNYSNGENKQVVFKEEIERQPMLESINNIEPLNDTTNIPNDPVEVLRTFFEAFNNRNEKLMIALSTAEMGNEIKEFDMVNNLFGIKYASLENVKVYTGDNSPNSVDEIAILCSWDEQTTLWDSDIPGWSFAFLVREHEVWKIAGIGASGP